MNDAERINEISQEEIDAALQFMGIASKASDKESVTLREGEESICVYDSVDEFMKAIRKEKK